MTCPKCKGFVLVEYGDIRCLNCGCCPMDPTKPAPGAVSRDSSVIRRTHCPMGHEYTEGTTATYYYADRAQTVRHCLVCRRAQRKANVKELAAGVA